MLQEIIDFFYGIKNNYFVYTKLAKQFILSKYDYLEEYFSEITVSTLTRISNYNHLKSLKSFSLEENEFDDLGFKAHEEKEKEKRSHIIDTKIKILHESLPIVEKLLSDLFKDKQRVINKSVFFIHKEEAIINNYLSNIIKLIDFWYLSQLNESNQEYAYLVHKLKSNKLLSDFF